MLSKPAPSPEIFQSLEAAFIEHYDWLLRWALQFTNHDRERAQDLVQQVFAQLALAHTDFSAVQNIRAYLYTTLRNTHISEVRLAGRSHNQSQSIVEYSIAEAALGASDPYSLFQTQDQLRRVCQYACLRKQTSRAGSVLILRFFHGYHISEIATVLGGTCQAVRQSLKFARNEARLFLDDPGALKLISRTQSGTVSFTGTVCAADELLAELRRAVFRSCEGECPGNDSLRTLYLEGHIVAAENTTLAHIVSCAKCLDAINGLLGLPLLAERHPADALGPNNNWRGGSGTSGNSGSTKDSLQARRRARNQNQQLSNSILLKCRRRATELFEHHPRELCVSVNGHVLGSQAVNSRTSHLRLGVTLTEPLNFIEVMGDERTRLLVMTIDPPPHGEPTQEQRIHLSEGRYIEASFRHGNPWPLVEVVYQNPNFTGESQVSPSTVEGMSRWNAASELSKFPVTVGSSFNRASQAGSFKPISRLLTGLSWANLARCRQAIISLIKQKQVAFTTVPSRWTSPGFITAILSIFLIGALLFLRLNTTPTVSAANLIQLASAAEETLNGEAGKAVYRVIDLEERAHAGGELIARRRIEIWRDPGRYLSARRVYDEKGQLIAGEWATHSKTKGVASRTIYHRGDVPRVEPSARNPQTEFRKLELWQLEPSAKDFAELIGHTESARVSEDSSVYVISYAGGQAIDGMLLQATLTLRKADLYAVEQTLVAQRGTETRQYRFVETSFERPSVRTIAPAVFEPDPELISEGLKEDGTKRKDDSPLLAVPSSIAATPDLELRVVYILDPFRARFGDQVNLIRTPDGTLVVKGIVDTEETRREILRALAPLIDNSALTVQIETVASALAHRPQSPPDRVISLGFAKSENAIPVYTELRRYFSEGNTKGQKESRAALEDDQVDQAVRSFAARVVGRSRRILSHAIELRQLKERFSRPQVLTSDAKAKWFSLVQNHTDALRRETSALREDLAPIFFMNEGSGSDSGSIQISTEADLAMAIDRLYKLASSVDETVRSAFTTSSDAPAAALIKSPRFRDSLIAAEKMAGSIRQAAE
jgi:RNA polymerase sigma factor (sigma-70 family)